jgi:flagellar biosynthetic protein FliO
LPETGIKSDGTDDFLLIRTLGGLGLVIGVILLAYVGIRRFGPKYLRRRSDQQSLSIIESLPLGEKRSVALIKVCDQRLLIGHTANQITLLTQLPVAQDHVPANEQKIEARAPSAVATFRRLYEVEQNRPSQPESKQIPPDLRAKMRQLREALEK